MNTHYYRKIEGVSEIGLHIYILVRHLLAFLRFLLPQNLCCKEKAAECLMAASLWLCTRIELLSISGFR